VYTNLLQLARNNEQFRNFERRLEANERESVFFSDKKLLSVVVQSFETPHYFRLVIKISIHAIPSNS
jgi:hypothetical protein